MIVRPLGLVRGVVRMPSGPEGPSEGLSWAMPTAPSPRGSTAVTPGSADAMARQAGRPAHGEESADAHADVAADRPSWALPGVPSRIRQAIVTRHQGRLSLPDSVIRALGHHGPSLEVVSALDLTQAVWLARARDRLNPIGPSHP